MTRIDKEVVDRLTHAAQKGKKNIYVCSTCKGYIVTVDLDDGRTPLHIPCQKDGCYGWMDSSNYEVGDQSTTADYEWWRPDEAELEAVPQHNRSMIWDHVLNGNLLIRKARAR